MIPKIRAKEMKLEGLESKYKNRRWVGRWAGGERHWAFCVSWYVGGRRMEESRKKSWGLLVGGALI